MLAAAERHHRELIGEWHRPRVDGILARMPPEVAIRSARSSDYEPACILLDSLDRLHRDRVPWMFRDPGAPARSQKEFESLLHEADSRVVIAELVTGQVIGIAHGVIRAAPELRVFVPQRFGVLDGLVVDPAFRRRGVGRRLTASFEQWALERGAAWVELNVYELNAEALEFYESLGFLPLSRKLRKPRPSVS